MNSQTISIKNGETSIVGDLQITFISCGRRIMENGSDPSLFSLMLSTPQFPQEERQLSFDSTNEEDTKDILFDGYTMQIVEVDFYGNFITMMVSK